MDTEKSVSQLVYDFIETTLNDMELVHIIKSHTEDEIAGVEKDEYYD